MSISTTCFDVETQPRPLAEIEQFMPKEWPLGNLKDPAKIELAVAEKRQTWLDDAALSPLTAQVLVIGLLSDNTLTVLDGEEKTILEQFWAYTDMNLGMSGRMVGFNCKLFDLKMLMARSWALGVYVPATIRTRRYGRVYFNEDIVDLRDEWQLGDKQAHGSLDTIGKLLTGLPKLGHGKDFAALYKSDKAAAIAYLERDLQLCKGIYEKICV